MAEEFGTVVIGAGLAGGTVVESLRNAGYTARIALIGTDPAAPYYRPDLSKKVMIEGRILPTQPSAERTGTRPTTSRRSSAPR